MRQRPDGRRQLVAVHRVPDKTQLVAAGAGSDDLAYSDAWSAASRVSRSRRVLSADDESVARPRQHADGHRQGTMRVETDVEMSDDRDAGRRASNAGSELGEWINKYQKSDHHADRLVRTIVQYEQATGQRFPDSKLIPANYYEIKRNHVSALPDVVYVKTASTDTPPITYGLPTLGSHLPSTDYGAPLTTSTKYGVSNVAIQLQDLPPLRRPSIDYGTPATPSKYGVSNVSIQLQPAMTGSTRRPPVVPRLSVTTSRAASLPPVSVDSVHRRRASVSSAYSGGPGRVRYASPAPPGLPTIRQGELGSSVTGHRRASYSSASPNYRATYVSTSGSRQATPDRSMVDEDVSRYLASAGRPSVAAAAAWSTRSRSPSPAANTYALPAPPGTPRMSDARRKIRKLLNRMNAD